MSDDYTSPDNWCDTHAIGRAECGCDPTTIPGLIRYDTIQPEPISWLWRHRIARGKLNTLEGDPGVSKSTLALTIAAHVSTGRDWPDGTPCPTGNVLVMAAEDGRGDTIRPRLDLAGADATRVHHVEGVLAVGPDGESLTEPSLAHIAGLERHVKATGAVLLIVDVLMAYMPRGVDSHRDHDVRVALKPLAQMADRTGCAVILIRHLNKGTGPAMYRAGGSIGITGLVRCANIVARSPDDDALVVFAPGKNNLAPDSEGLTYTLESVGDHPRIRWVGTTRLGADELLTRNDDDREEHDALVAWIRDYLTAQGGEASARDVSKAAADAFGPIAKATLHRARKRAGVVTSKGGMATGWVWTLTP